MEPFVVLEAVAAPLAQPADTDQILPARYLRRPRSAGYQGFLFHDMRFHPDGSEKIDFMLNQARYRNAKILVGDRNFGTGSSREQAPWGLIDYGIRCVIAADFGEIFYLNSLKSGLLPVALPLQVCIRLREQLGSTPGATLRVDLPRQTVSAPNGQAYTFEIDPFRKRALLEGLDDIAFTLQNEEPILAFEQDYRHRFDWIFDVAR